MTSALAGMTSGSGQEVAGMNTWGISGPRFLLLYAALLAVTVLAVALARRRVLAAPAAHGPIPARLDPYEAAYLNGGSELVATAAVSNLLRGGHLANSSRGRRRTVLVTRAPLPAGAHPVEWAAHQLVAAPPDRSLGEVKAALGRAPAVAAVLERLRLGGLAPTPEQQARYRAAVLWFVPLLALGVARVLAGRANGRPVGFLVGLLAVTVVVAAVLALRVPNATELGRRTLERLRLDSPRPTGGVASPGELSMAVALFGAGVLWTADSDTALLMRVPRETGGFGGGHYGGGDGGGGGCGGGGGGCGGGGCGGGGCGG